MDLSQIIYSSVAIAGGMILFLLATAFVASKLKQRD